MDIAYRLAYAAKGEIYNVVHVKGIVVNKKTGRPLKYRISLNQVMS